MRDHVTEELVSAYVDGELEGDELKLVERLLAESAEHRQLLAEFQSLRASLWVLPTLKLPADFHTRVIERIEESHVIPSKEPVRRAGGRPKIRPWRSVLFAAASLAAVIALTVMLNPPREARVGSRTLDTVPVFLQVAPTYVLVYDVTVTSDGQKNKVIGTLLKQLGIVCDPAQRLDKKVARQLRAIRESKQAPGATEAVPYATDPATPKSTGKDTVEMSYLAGKLDTLGALGTALAQMGEAGKEVALLRYDLVEETDKFGVMHRLHNSARDRFAVSPHVNSSDNGYAISFHLEMKSVSVPGVATFPTLGFNANRAGQADVAHVLLIVRNVDANAEVDANADGGK